MGSLKIAYFICANGCGSHWEVDWKDLDKNEQEKYLKEKKSQGEDFCGVKWDDCEDCME